MGAEERRLATPSFVSGQSRSAGWSSGLYGGLLILLLVAQDIAQRDSRRPAPRPGLPRSFIGPDVADGWAALAEGTT